MLIKFENERDWLAAKAKDITSTELAALFGVSKFKSRRKLWHEKKGDVEPDFEETDLSRWGKRLQNAVAAGIAEDNGWICEDLHLVYARDPARRLGSSFDNKMICSNRGDGLTEIKVTEVFSEDNGWFRDHAPIDYEFQIQGELHAAEKENQGIRWGAIGVLGTRQATRLYFRSYDADLGRMIDEEAEKFWESIEANDPPKPDYSVDGELLAKLRKPLRSGDIINLSTNNRAHELIATYLASRDDARIHRKRAEVVEKQMEEVKAELHTIIGRNEIALIGDYQVGARVQEVEEFFNPGYSFRRLDISKRKKGK